ncbi:MAG: helix-turn-helix transcriptional regulator [candidate division WOR-3 bacterium]
MPKKYFIFPKEMAEILRKIPERAGLSQTEVAERIGLSNNSFAYISFLESCKIKNPSLGVILLYLELVARLGLGFLGNWIRFVFR